MHAEAGRRPGTRADGAQGLRIATGEHERARHGATFGCRYRHLTARTNTMTTFPQRGRSLAPSIGSNASGMQSLFFPGRNSRIHARVHLMGSTNFRLLQALCLEPDLSPRRGATERFP
ncbi:hypothetical protein WPS_02200 [Vulcanimicrobium alpinum]|uniref:Uncharacterized protein n=1 Tax=Vulcanimicrobium alpinum TaxID=3016050 RepID=A0AAN1XTM7_UNVUL|nr:hypothetical protein WPS_02200 [Vulcanimicrobium alpinum]